LNTSKERPADLADRSSYIYVSGAEMLRFLLVLKKSVLAISTNFSKKSGKKRYEEK